MKKLSLLILLFFIFLKGNAQNNLYIPEVLSGANFQLAIKDTFHYFYPNTKTNTFGINGSILAPTIFLNKGDSITLNVINNLMHPTTMHWHGMHVAPTNDGGPHTVIEGMSNWAPHFKVRDDAATLWYHPHLHHHTHDQVMKGLAGLIIIKDPQEALLDLPRTYGIDDFPLILQTKVFDIDTQIILGHSELDSIPMVNATLNPILAVPNQVVRFRVLNGGSQRVYYLGLSNQAIFYQIASDGGLLNEPVALTRLLLAPGERAEILIPIHNMIEDTFKLLSYASELPKGIYGAEKEGTSPVQIIPNYSSNPLNGLDFELITFYKTDTTAFPIYNIATNLNQLSPFDPLDANNSRFFQLNFAETGAVNAVLGPFTINDVSFNMEVINDTVYLNDIEIWEIFNHSGIAHPFHLHNVPFYIIERSTGSVPLNEQGKKDVVLVKSNETVKFITKFNDFYNDSIPYMYHCHMLIHEDEGMMGQYLVVEKKINRIEEGFEKKYKEIYPNPSFGRFTIKSTLDQIHTILIYNAQGKLIKTIYQTQGSDTISIENPIDYSGIIFIKVWNNDESETFKLHYK